jgi:hypothetical protein
MQTEYFQSNTCTPDDDDDDDDVDDDDDDDDEKPSTGRTTRIVKSKMKATVTIK